MISGCGWPWKKGDPIFGNPDKKIGTAVKNIDANTTIINDASKDIKDKAISIDDTADKIEVSIPEENRTKVGPYVVSIKENSELIIQNTERIDQATSAIKSTSVELKTIKTKVKELDTALKKAIKERDKAIEEKNSQFARMLRWLILACIVGAGLSMAAFIMYGSKAGMTGAAVCGIVLAVALAVQTYLVYLAIAGAIILAGLIGYIIYQAYIQRKALRETIDTVELTKNNLPIETKAKLFGEQKGETGLMDTLQSPTTMKLIEKERNHLSPLWNYAKRHKE
jgi:uncharacterized protein YaaW (UPF0174 family)